MYFTWNYNGTIVCSKKCPKPVLFNNNNYTLSSSMTKNSKRSFLIQNSYYKSGSQKLNFANNNNNKCYNSNSKLINSCINQPPKNTF